jgi:hypothetical protein
MSAFVIDSATMGRVLRGLFARNDRGQIVLQFDGEHTDFGHPRSADPTDVGRKLFAMNLEAVMQRYPDCRDNPDDWPGPHGAHALATEYRAPALMPGFHRGAADLVDFYKAIRCLIYQCSEGDIPNSPLFLELQRAAAELAHGIIETLPGYQRAGW